MTGVQLQPLVDALRDVVLGQQVIHADETPVQMLMPGTKKTHRSYVWAYAASQFSDVAAVVYDFSPSRAGEHARNFLNDWKGKLVCDDFGGYKASFELGVTEIGVWLVRGVSSSNCTLRIKARLQSKPCVISSCCTKSKVKSAIWNRFTAPNTARKGRPENEYATCLDDRPARSGARRLSHQQSTRLQPETLGSAVALPR